ncbi:MAG: helix-turn-helix transcriptional regulator [Bacteroidales bacterium]|nr:helix-turn-helix transcriptional regulator [Bacteroidales bacterium]
MVDLRRIKLLCNEAGITLKKLSDKTKISQTAITMAMQRNSTTLETLEKIAKYFRISVGVFFGEEDIFVPIRNSFEKFDSDLKSASNLFMTTIQYYAPELKYPTDIDTFFDAANKISPEVVNILEFTFNKLAENPTCLYLQEFTFDEILKMRNNGILSKDVTDFILTVKNTEIFADENFPIKIGEETEPNFWEKLKKGIANSKERLK